MFVDTVKNRNSPPAVLVRESYWENGKSRKRTLANLSKLPPAVIEAVRRELKSSSDRLPADFEVVRNVPHGHVAAVLGTCRNLGLHRIIEAKPSRSGRLCLAMIAARIIEPRSKLATCRGFGGETLSDSLGECLEVADADANELYKAMDWLAARQARIEKRLAGRHLEEGALVMYDLTSTWVCGERCELADYGYSRDGKKGTKQIEFGLLCDAEGRPVAIEAFSGSASDPETVAVQVTKLKQRFKLSRVVLVGDRGMLTSARIDEDLKPAGLDWITSLRADAIRGLVAAEAFQPSLFDELDMAEITCEALYPGERLVVCRNPLLAERRRLKRLELLAATEKRLDEIVAATQRDKYRLKREDLIVTRVTRALDKHKMAKHFEVETGPGFFSYRRRRSSIEREAALDGFYVVRTSVEDGRLDSGQVVHSYKRLSKVERAFRSLKTVDLKVRPIHHRLETRVRAHLLLCMLAFYVEFEMRRRLAPMLFDDEESGRLAVRLAEKSAAARSKAARKRTADGRPVHSFQTLLRDLATLCRNRVRPMKMKRAEYWMVTRPTALQHKALELLEVNLKTP